MQLTEKQESIYNFIKNNNEVDRNKIVEALSIPRTTIFDNIAVLEYYELVQKVVKHEGRGRPRILYQVV